MPLEQCVNLKCNRLSPMSCQSSWHNTIDRDVTERILDVCLFTVLTPSAL